MSQLCFFNKKESILDFISNLELQDGVYIVLLGIDDKISDYIKKYNYIPNSKYNHVALLCIEDNQKIIYDVHPRKIKFTKKISVQTLNEFIEFSDKNVNYFGVWKIPWIKSNQLEKLINLNLKITYDYKFENKSNLKLYCSEFVAKTIDKSLSIPFKWIIIKRNLGKVEKYLLKKDSIEYYPTDFFLKTRV